jgi:hypothetical protein
VSLLLVAAAIGQADDRPPQEDAVFEAVFRQQLRELLDASARSQGMVLCLGINPGSAPQSPSKEYMARFRTEKAVRRLSECEARAKGAVENLGQAPATIVTAGPIEWLAADDVRVTVSVFRSSQRSRVRSYRVVKDPGGWVSLGPVFVDVPGL